MPREEDSAASQPVSEGLAKNLSTLTQPQYQIPFPSTRIFTPTVGQRGSYRGWDWGWVKATLQEEAWGKDIGNCSERKDATGITGY